MKNYRFIFFVLIILMFLIPAAVFAQEEFHSEFGILPPEIPSGSGDVADELDSLVDRLDQSSMPPSHRLRYVYEWLMQKFQYFPEDQFTRDMETDPESVSQHLHDVLKLSEADDAGYALLSHYILDRMGFPTVIIDGELSLADGSSQAHQWNYVYYSEKWYHFDPLGEKLNPLLNGFMNVQKELANGALSWDETSIPPSADYAVRAFGCHCDFTD